MSEDAYSRPTSVPEMRARMESFVTPEGLKIAQEYRPAPSDVFVVTPPKCGTTWMQQIVHGLRTRGSMDFDNINQVVPWLQMAYDMGQSLEDPQGARPHAFKTHSPLGEVPKGGRYIAVLREPTDALMSQYRFFEGAFFETGSIDIETFARDFYLTRSEFPPSGIAVHSHLLASWSRRHDPDVLLLCYENMKADLPSTVERVAQFIDIELDQELLKLVVRQSSIEFMKLHENKFDDSEALESIRHRMKLPPTPSLSKVVDGQVGASSTTVPDVIKQQIRQAWTTEVTPHTGLATYHDLIQELSCQALSPKGVR